MIKETIETLIEGQDLSQETVQRAMEFIMTGEATPAQLAAFLTALRMKGETVEEIAGFATTMREMSTKVKTSRSPLVDTCGTGGDASGTLYLSASDGFLAEIASSLLGVEPEEICLDVEGKDALNEMANIITGSLILQLGGDTESISLGLPRKLEKAHEYSEESDIVEGIVETCGQVMRVTWVPGDAHEKSAA